MKSLRFAVRSSALALCGLLNLAAPTLAPLQAKGPALQTQLDAVVDQAIAEQRIVGAVVLVSRDRQIIYHRAAGLADREAQRPMREDAVFRLASMTKALVSATALSLVDAGKLRLDDPVTRWIPDFRPKLADGREPTLTVRELMTHTAGLSYGIVERPDGPLHRLQVSDGLDQPGLSIEENLRRLAQAPLLFEPGTKWSYSLGIDVLGKVVAEAGGAPLPELMRRLVTGPLGMGDTSFTTTTDTNRLAVPYADGQPQPVRMGELYVMHLGTSEVRFVPGRVFDPKSFASGGAGAVGTAGDYLKFLETIRNGGQPILKAESARAMTTNALGAVAGPSKGEGFGLGFAVLENPAANHTPQHVGTWRWGGVYGHAFWVDPTAKLSVVIMTNTAVAGSEGTFPNAVRDAIYRAMQEESAP